MKLTSTIKTQSAQKQVTKAQEAECSDILYDDSAPTNKMVAQAKGLERPIEFLKCLQKLGGKLETLAREVEALEGEANDLRERIKAFSSNLQSGLSEAFLDVKRTVVKICDGMTEQLLTSREKLEAFELKLVHFSISDSDQFFISKEVNKIRGFATQIDFQRESVSERVE
jgi:hypothetical protein